MNVQQLIDFDVSQKEEKKVTSWQASKLGSCLCGVYLERIGVKPLEEIDDRTKRVFRCGNLFEEYVIAKIRESGQVKVEEQVRIEDPTLGVTGYADIVLEHDNWKEVVEVKSQHSKSFWYMTKKGEGAYEHHMMQLLIYMHVLKIEMGRIVYVSKDDLCIQEYQVDIHNPILQKAFDNIAKLNEALKTGILPEAAPEGSFQAKYCRYHKYCTGELPLPALLKA